MAPTHNSTGAVFPLSLENLKRRTAKKISFNVAGGRCCCRAAPSWLPSCFVLILLVRLLLLLFLVVLVVDVDDLRRKVKRLVHSVTLVIVVDDVGPGNIFGVSDAEVGEGGVGGLGG